jgi:hypothetical protein
VPSLFSSVFSSRSCSLKYYRVFSSVRFIFPSRLTHLVGTQFSAYVLKGGQCMDPYGSLVLSGTCVDYWGISSLHRKLVCKLRHVHIKCSLRFELTFCLFAKETYGNSFFQKTNFVPSSGYISMVSFIQIQKSKNGRFFFNFH